MHRARDELIEETITLDLFAASMVAMWSRNLRLLEKRLCVMNEKEKRGNRKEEG